MSATTEEELEMVEQMEPGIEEAQKKLIELAADDKARRLAEWREKQLHDMSSLYAAGLREGQEKSKILTARIMLWLKIPIDEISLCTRLTTSEIEKLTPLKP
ncbi:MAG: hypothetical protein LBT38_01250 [Deltaproteobacteria bacterium]|nr:hypothetical protein [Deltaproteobacteria bacterium]